LISRRDAAIEILRDAFDDRHQALQAASGQRREKRHRRERREGHLGVNLRREFVLAVLPELADEVVLVPDDDQRSCAPRAPARPAAGPGSSDLERVDQQHGDVAASDRLERAQGRIVFDRAVMGPLFADAGRIDEAKRPAFPREQGVDRVARRARNVGTIVRSSSSSALSSDDLPTLVDRSAAIASSGASSAVGSSAGVWRRWRRASRRCLRHHRGDTRRVHRSRGR